MQIEIWSDVVCPWCYLGKRRLESAIARFDHAAEVAITWRSFELDPDAPRQGTLTEEMLTRKYRMSREDAVQANARLTALGAGEGLEYHLDRTRVANSFDAHRMIHLAAARGIAGVLEERLFRAYFTESVAIGDPEELVRLAVDVGIGEKESRDCVQGARFTEDVRADEEKARGLGITGVPFFVIEGAWGISGAQASDAFLQALDQIWSELHPKPLESA